MHAPGSLSHKRARKMFGREFDDVDGVVGKRSRNPSGTPKKPRKKKCAVRAPTEPPPPRNTAPCVTCGGGDDEGLVYLCDKCDTPYHAHCVGFKGSLQGDWFCPPCEQA